MKPRTRAGVHVQMEALDIHAAFKAALTHGPTLIVAHMDDASHAATKDPITEYSPLIRAAILAVNLGAQEVTFDIHSRYATAVYMFQPPGTPAMKAIANAGVPALGVHHDALNGWLAGAEVSMRGEHLAVSVTATANNNLRIDMIDVVDYATVDFANPRHLKVLRAVETHFIEQGWTAAARRVAAILAKPPAPAPALPRPWALRPDMTAAEAQAKADAWAAENAAASTGAPEALGSGDGPAETPAPRKPRTKGRG